MEGFFVFAEDGVPVATFWQVVGAIVVSLGSAGGIGTFFLKLQSQRHTSRIAEIEAQADVERKKLQLQHDLELVEASAVADREAAARKEAFDRQAGFITSLQTEVVRLNARLDIEEKRRADYEAKIDRIEAEAALYRDRLTSLELRGDEVPIIAWERDIEGRLLTANNEFERQLLAPINKARGWAMGKTADETWGKETAATLATITEAAIKSPGKEAVGLDVVFDPALGPFLVVKKQRLWQGRAVGMFAAAVSMSRLVNPPKPC
jgi:hypothetical protein